MKFLGREERKIGSKSREEGHIGVPNQSCGSWTFFFNSNTFFCFNQKVCLSPVILVASLVCLKVPGEKPELTYYI